MKSIRVTFADKQLKRSFDALADGKFEDRELRAAIERAKESLERDPQHGVRIPLRLVPKHYIAKYGVSNLWKVNLPRAWRLLYSIVGDEVQIVSMILEWLPHKEYERRFGYG